MTIVLRLCFGLTQFLVTYAVLACTCTQLSVGEAKRGADVVLAGRVESVELVDSPSDWEPRLIVTFRVARVWKGPVTETFQMHTNLEASTCTDFYREFLQGNQTLLVYGYGRPASTWKTRHESGAANAQSFTVRPENGQPIRQDLIDAVPDERVVYTTNICTRTTPVPLAVEDFKKLGEANQLAALEVLPDPALVESLRFISNKAPGECGDLTNARVWKVLARPPTEVAALLSAFEASGLYEGIPKPLPVKYKEYWFASDDGRMGMCRVAIDKSVVCGNAEIQFVEDPPGSGKWRVGGDSGVYTYCKQFEKSGAKDGP